MSFKVSAEETRWRGTVRRFTLEGQLDTRSIQNLEKAIQAEQARGGEAPWVMDLEKLEYISSAGVAVFIGLGYDVEGRGGLCFYGATEKVRSVFELLGLTDVFAFYSDEAEAREKTGH